IKLLREAGAKLLLQPIDIGIAVCLAVSKGDLATIQAWHAAGATFSEADYQGRTPLHAAVSCNDLEMVKYLCAAGADPNLCDNFGRSALDEARVGEKEEILNFLVDFTNWPNGNDENHRATFTIG
uniref:Uncharacterized protein n=1 Tax=Panagrolaimus sp. JU765 TaxID=591449 RepID=A0AC34QYT0_9BILA